MRWPLAALAYWPVALATALHWHAPVASAGTSISLAYVLLPDLGLGPVPRSYKYWPVPTGHATSLRSVAATPLHCVAVLVAVRPQEFIDMMPLRS